ncbi:unnamed protein product [Allacma fusca]|uniref:Uncharacterized protein n=1 Tax=Allacma fusca TaxID=39272 RepID=A0A8J2P6H9_9HEXA|nr:unnamed protein product [Allacma fusca]
MISEKLVESFKIIFKISTALRIIPFDYNWKTNRLEVPTSKVGNVISVVCMLLFGMKFTFSAYRLIQLSDMWKENIKDLSLTVFYFFIFWNNIRFQVNYWRKQETICWTFNQLAEFAESVSFRKRSTFPEKVMLTWIPSHINIFFQLMSEFLTFPTSGHHVFSIFDATLQDLHVKKSHTLVRYTTTSKEPSRIAGFHCVIQALLPRHQKCQ